MIRNSAYLSTYKNKGNSCCTRHSAVRNREYVILSTNTYV